MIEIVPYQDGDREAWDAFVLNHPEGRVCHLIGYGEMIRETFGYEPIYWFLRRRGEPVGVFPFFFVRTWLGVRKFLSQPFIEYGGPLVNRLTEDELMQLQKAVKKVLRQYRVQILEVCGGFGIPETELNKISRRVAFNEYAVLPLRASKKIWQDSLSRHVRKAIRKAERAGLRCDQETSTEALRESFYPLYLVSMKRLGSPPHSLMFFQNSLKYLRGQTKLFLVRKNGIVIAALLGFTTGRRVHIVFSVSDPRFWERRPNDLVHWKFIEWACNHGYEWFDFGTVRYDSQRQYKKKWGVEFREYARYVMFHPGRANTSVPLNSSSKGIQFLSALWHTCMPGIAARLIGPSLHRLLAL